MAKKTKEQEVSENIMSNILLKNNKIDPRICEDQKVCQIEFKSGEFEIPDRPWSRDKIGDRSIPRIVLVLESPHVKEFECTPPQPASGRTGDKIQSLLSDKLIGLGLTFTDGLYDLILVNAIQLQCSMGVPTKYFRDIAFIGLWFEGFDRNFIDRVNRLNLTNEDFVINCCTKKDTSQFKGLFGRRFSEKAVKEILDNNSISYRAKNGLRSLVGIAINEITSSIDEKDRFKLASLDHPSSWK